MAENRNEAGSNTYPKRDGMVLTLMDDYGNSPTYKEANIDFSTIHNKALAEEAISAITEKYNSHTGCVTYLCQFRRVVYHFDEYASAHDIESFNDYTDDVKDDYRDFIINYEKEDGSKFKESYIQFLVSAPTGIRNCLLNQ